MKHKVVALTQTCDSRPSRWEGTLSDGGVVCIRYRYAALSWGVGDTLDEAVEASWLYWREIWNHHTEIMTTVEMEKYLEDVFDFTEIQHTGVAQKEE